jgi:EmrB/QacA subfamily drug resistance transporter
MKEVRKKGRKEGEGQRGKGRAVQYKWTALAVTMVGTIMGSLDQRIIVIGLPTIAKQLLAGPEELVWISQAYSLATTVSLLIIGRIGDMYGRVKLYNFGFIVFTLGSILSALSQNSSELIGFRIVQGVGSALIFTNSSAIITDASPVKDLGIMLGINQSGLRIGSMLALTVSGLILSVTNWRGLFYVNVPIGILGTIWAYLKLREISVRDVSRRVDLPGFTIFTLSLSTILLGITFLSYGILGSAEGYSLVVVGLVLMGLFVRVESKSKSPMLDLRLFAIRIFAAANIAQLLNALTWTGLILLLAFYLQIALRYSPLQAGLGILPVDAAFMIMTIISGRLSDRYGSRLLATAGIVVQALGFLILATLGTGASYLEVAVVLVVFGVGNGLFNTPNTREIMASVPANRRGIASGFRSLVYNIGLTLSYGLVILFITIGIPYNALSQLLQGNEATSYAATIATQAFVNGFRITCLIFSAIIALAVAPSILRGTAKQASTAQLAEGDAKRR